MPPEITLFNELKSGDRVVTRLRESIVVSARPGLKPQLLTDTTAEAAKQPARRSRPEAHPAAHDRCHDRERRSDNAIGHLQGAGQSADRPCRPRPATARRSQARRRRRGDAHARARRSNCSDDELSDRACARGGRTAWSNLVNDVSPTRSGADHRHRAHAVPSHRRSLSRLGPVARLDRTARRGAGESGVARADEPPYRRCACWRSRGWCCSSRSS